MKNVPGVSFSDVDNYMSVWQRRLHLKLLREDVDRHNAAVAEANKKR